MAFKKNLAGGEPLAVTLACAGAGSGAGWPSSGFLSFDTPPVSDVRICSRLTAMSIKRAGNRLQQMHRSHDPQWPRYRFVTSI